MNLLLTDQDLAFQGTGEGGQGGLALPYKYKVIDRQKFCKESKDRSLVHVSPDRYHFFVKLRSWARSF